MIWLLAALLLAFAGFVLYLLWYYILRHRAAEAEMDRAAVRAWLGVPAARPEPVSVTADDDVTLCGTFLPKKNARGTVLLLHSCGSSWAADFALPARRFYEAGFQLLLADERAHGRSGGRAATYGVWERFDARAWLHFLAWRCGEGHPLFLYGLAEGAAAALMSTALELPGNVRGVVAESAYDLPRDFVAAKLKARGFPLSEGLADAMSGCASVLFDFTLKEYRTRDALRESAYPALLLHGGDDPLVPAADAGFLRSVCAAGAELLVVEGAGHGDCWETDAARVWETVAAFLDRNSK